MATESAVTTEHSHPFAPVADLSLVHNGSLSNYATVRRRLTRDGVRFVTDNDSEVAARYLAHRISLGADLGSALRQALTDLEDEIQLIMSGGIRSGADVAKALALGATAVSIGVAPLVALGCNSRTYVTDGQVLDATSDYRALGTEPGYCHHMPRSARSVPVTTSTTSPR